MSKLKKRYYWLKLKEGFFKRHDLRIIEAMPNGKDYVLFYLKMLCESISHEGALRFSKDIPYTDEMLATITNTNVDMVKTAMELLKQLGLVIVREDGTIFMTELPAMIGSETGMAKYMRERRMLENAKALGEFQNVVLTEDEIKSLQEFYPSYWANYIEKLSVHKKSTGKNYESDYATIKAWLMEDVGEFEEKI